ncbi:MAG TPA: peptidylprolyl isomerase [Terriglobales bacterium]|nr:peptidylprolyl isomerase [Terriglobales bacterium]
MRSVNTIALVLLLASYVCAQTSGSKAATHKPATSTKSASSTATSGNPVAVFDTTAGKLRCTLFEKQTPMTVANFIGLATGTKDWTNPVSHVTKHKTPLYDGTIFHRVIPNFMIQGGDPAGNGSGDPGYTFKDEIVSGLTFDRPGRLAMANSGPNTNGSQFFITEVPTPHLNGRHTIFGQCDDASVALVKQIARMARDPRDDRPFRPVRITHVTIEKGGATATKPPTKKPSAAASKPGQ